MKNHLKHSVNLLLVISFLLLGNVSAFSQNKEAGRVAELDEMDFNEILHSVDLGKNADDIRKKQIDEGKNLLKFFNKSNGCNVETFRNKEVIVVTIPAHLLFAPNEVDLSSKAGDYLEHFKKYLKEPDKYRVLLVMHTDNTGSELYREWLTEDRADAIFDWFDQTNGVDTSYLFTYSFADENPLFDNDSKQNREKNRRLEVYIMPGQKMVDQYKK